MSIHIQPRPLDAPLPGGQAGATVTVEPLVCGAIRMPAETMERHGRSPFATLRLLRGSFAGQGVVVPVPCFLIRHPGAGPVLVDTGLHPSIGADPIQNFGRTLARVLAPSLAAGQDAVSQLRARGLEPDRVGVVVMTHLHVDHASAISELPDSTFVVCREEWESAIGPRPTRRGYRHAHFDHAFDYRSLSYDGPRIGSYSTFGRTFDLFGDGSVRVAYTPGHTAGHQSVICRLREHDLVIGGDASYMLRQIADEKAALPAEFQDEHNFRRSLREIRLFHRQFPAAEITPGHDPDFYVAAANRIYE